MDQSEKCSISFTAHCVYTILWYTVFTIYYLIFDADCCQWTFFRVSYNCWLTHVYFYLQACHRCDGDARLEINDPVSPTPHSWGFPSLGHPADPPHWPSSQKDKSQPLRVDWQPVHLPPPQVTHGTCPSGHLLLPTPPTCLFLGRLLQVLAVWRKCTDWWCADKLKIKGKVCVCVCVCTCLSFCCWCEKKLKKSNVKDIQYQ